MVQHFAISNLLGAAASGLCAIHCAVTPLLFAARPMLEVGHGEHGHAHGSPAWALLDYVFLVLSFVAVYYSARQTDRSVIKAVLWASWVLFALGIGLEAFHLPFGHVAMYAGSAALIITHWANYRHCRSRDAQCAL